MLDEIARPVDHSGRNATRATRTESNNLTVRMLKYAQALWSRAGPAGLRSSGLTSFTGVDQHAGFARNLSRCLPE